ncbi:hypothetical protein [Streptomyces griseofuscus]|uniref:hypothetical protein n=1 Tax=Streptomyces griseofuscus TaxID=146922 RepID=UPI0033DBA74F
MITRSADRADVLAYAPRGHGTLVLALQGGHHDGCDARIPVDRGVGYRSAEKKPFGAKFSLPEPLGIEIDTEDLKQYVG